MCQWYRNSEKTQNKESRVSVHIQIIPKTFLIYKVVLTFRWRLQRAFFTKTSVGSLGCNGIGCRDFFPVLSCTRPEHNPNNEPPVMGDLEGIKPEYISCMAVDYWPKEEEESSYAVMALSPTEFERIDYQDGEPKVTEKLNPRNVSVADAMVTSAAVMTLSPEQEEPYRDLQVQLGLTLRKGFSTEEEGIASKVGDTESEFTFLRKLTYFNK